MLEMENLNANEAKNIVMNDKRDIIEIEKENGVLNGQYLNTNHQHHVHFKPTVSEIGSSYEQITHAKLVTTPITTPTPEVKSNNKNHLQPQSSVDSTPVIISQAQIMREQLKLNLTSSNNTNNANHAITNDERRENRTMNQRHSIFINRDNVINSAEENRTLRHSNKRLSIAAHHGICTYFCCCCNLSTDVDQETSAIPSSIHDPEMVSANHSSHLTAKQRLKIYGKVILKLLIGILLSSFVCSSWLMMTFLVRKLINDLNSNRTLFATYNIEKTDFFSCNLCYFLIWFATCFLVPIYPIYFVFYVYICCNIKSNLRDKSITKLQVFKQSLQLFNKRKFSPFAFLKLHKNTTSNNVSQNINNSNDTNNKNNTSNNIDHVFKFSFLKDLFLKIGGLTLIWIITGYGYLKAIDLISFSDVILLFSTNFALYYMASWIVLHNKFIPIKLVALILSIVSIVFVVYSDDFKFDSKFFGNICAGIASAGTAVLKLIVDFTMKQKTNAHRAMFFSLIGLFNMLFCWPIIIILHATHLEFISLAFLTQYFDHQFEYIWLYIMGSIALAFIFMFLLQYGSTITYETFIEFGCFLTIPIAKIIDGIFFNTEFNDLKIAAFISIIIAYIFLMLPDNTYEFIKKYICPSIADEKETNSLTRKYQNTIHGNS